MPVAMPSFGPKSASVVTPTLSANQNNWDPTGSGAPFQNVEVSTDDGTTRTLTGIVAPATGQTKWLLLRVPQASPGNVFIQSLNGSSDAANQVRSPIHPTGITLLPGVSLLLYHDGTNWKTALASLADGLPAAPGTAGQVLSTGGLGAPMSWITPGGGGALEFVSTTTTVGLVSAVDITGFDGTAEAWLVRYKFWFDQAAAPGVRVRSGASFQTADYRFHSSQPKDNNSAYAGLVAATTDRFKIPGTVASFATNRPITGSLIIYDPAATDHRKTMTVDMGHWDANSVILRHVTAHGAWDGGDGAIDQLRFLASIGNFAIGATFHLFKRTAA